MPATVVNIKRGEPYDVYIGRAGHGHDGYFGNPIRLGQQCPECRLVHISVGDTIPCFERYFIRRIAIEAEFRERALELRGKRLGCFCKPNPCHGDVIASWVNSWWRDC